MEPSSLPDAPEQESGTDDQGLMVRYLTDGIVDPFDTVEWERRDAWPGDEQHFRTAVKVPTTWSQQALDIVSKLYLASGSYREDGVDELIQRIASKYAVEGVRHGYLGDYAVPMTKGNDELSPLGRVAWLTSRPADDQARILYDELCYVMIHQMAAFNSPVWFNVGRPDRRQQISACFILGLRDTTESIMETGRREVNIFRGGSGSGFDVSRLRGSMEPLSTGGTSSGPVSFMRMWDACAGTFKSAGSTRRAAKLLKCDVDHPDIRDFITCKQRDEERMRILVAAGVDIGFSIQAERNLAEFTAFQNANNSVGASDDFMRAVTDKAVKTSWPLVWRTADRYNHDPTVRTYDPTIKTYVDDDADELLDLIAKAAHDCADPGMLFMDTINSMHTTPSLNGETSPIRSTNPCFPGDTLVDTSDGRVRIDALSEMHADGHRLPMAFGFDCEAGLPVMKQIRQAWLSKMTTELVEVTTDKGVIFRCTPEHKILTRGHGRSSSGEYVEAQNLVSGQRLRKIVRLHNFSAIDITEAELVEFWEQASTMYEHGALSPGRWNDQIKKFGMSGRIPLAKYDDCSIRGLSWNDFKSWIEERSGLVNDTVESVMMITLENSVPVYDISVEDTHNFAVASDGVEHAIVVSNCGEFSSNDDTSCNLASMNVLKFVRDDGFDVEGYRAVVDLMATAMDISISFGEFPDDLLRDNTRSLRQLGLGYSNMGAAIMAQGMAYDSDDARSFAAAVTALTTGRCYARSAELARRFTPFEHFEENREAMLGVIDKHVRSLGPRDEVDKLKFPGIWDSASADWGVAAALGRQQGFRNCQASVIAPAGTISYAMDCDTTGIEPPFSLVTYKTLAGGGSMTIVNQSVARGMRALGYHEVDVDDGCRLLKEYGVQQFIDRLAFGHRQVFAGANEISAEGHLRMVAAVQPFVSGGISKTINMPESVTWEDVREAYVSAWRLGLKGISIYRNNSKARQVLSSTNKVEEKMSEIEDDLVKIAQQPSENLMAESVVISPRLYEALVDPVTTKRRRLPRTRSSRTHKIHVRSAMGEHEGYITAGTYDDGTLGEMFLEGFGRSGGFVSNALAAWATAFSIAIQYGTPWEVIVGKHVGQSDETGGVVVPDPSGAPLVIRSCDSIVDYVSRWLVAEFGDVDLQEELGVMTDAVKARKMGTDVESEISPIVTSSWGSAVHDPAGDMLVVQQAATHVIVQQQTNGNGNGHARGVEMSANPCPDCRQPLQRAGSCWRCACGFSSGCG